MKNLHFAFIIALIWVCTSLLVGYVFSMTHNLDVLFMLFYLLYLHFYTLFLHFRKITNEK